MEVCGFLAAWVIGHGIIQSITPVLIKRFTGGHAPQGRSATVLAFLLALVIAGVILGLHEGIRADVLLVVGLGVFGRVRDSRHDVVPRGRPSPSQRRYSPPSTAC